MRGRLLVITLCLIATCAFQAQASIFSGGGGGTLQALFDSKGFDYIDVANYQTDLNFKLHGMMEFQLISESGPFADKLSFGVLEGQKTWWGTDYQRHTVFDRSAEPGATGSFMSNSADSDISFFISKRNPRRNWWKTHFYSFSPFNRFNSVQALFYQDPLNTNSYLIAWEGHHLLNPRSDGNYDDLVVRMTIHPAPEPATWVLLATGLVGLGVFVSAKRKRDVTQ
jgi:hypothetical protein